MFPAPMRAMCAQVWLVPTSVRVLHTLERGTAAYWGGGEAQEAACGGGKVAIPAILRRLPGPRHAVRLQDCKISTFGRALHHLDQAQAACRAAARHGRQFSAVAKLRYSAYGCVLPKIDHFMFKSKEKCSTSGVPEPHSPTL